MTTKQNMKFVKYIFLFATIFICRNAIAQKNIYLEGYVVNLKSDTIHGQVRFSNKNVYPKIIQIKSGGQEINYSSSEILYAEIIGRSKYFSKKVKYSVNPHQIGNITSNKEIIWKESQELLEAINLGQVNLYKFVDENSKTHFFINNNNEELENLFLLKYKKGRNTAVISKYKNVLKKVLNDCQDIYEKIDNSNFTQKSLQSIIQFYNDCKNIRSFYISEAHKMGLEIYLKGGISFSKRFFRQKNHSINPSGEISFEIIIPKNLGLINAIGYRSYNAPITTASNSNIVNFKFIRYNLGLKKIILNNKIMSSLNGGIMNSISINNPYDGFNTYSQGFFFGFESFYKNWGIELRFEGKNFWLSDTSFRKEYSYMMLLNHRIFKSKYGR